MLTIKNISFEQTELNYIDQSFNEDFKGLWRIDKEDDSLEIDVFQVYKFLTDHYIIMENNRFRYYGNLDECLLYIHHWL